MRCPRCEADNDRVFDSRPADEGRTIRRRRECLVCKHRFTTYERVEEAVLKVVKKDGYVEPFSRDKMRRGLEKACWKRPINSQQLDKLIQAVEEDLVAGFESEVPSREIGEVLMRQLSTLDPVAYVRFASVYREFKDARDFVQEIQPILAQRLNEDGKP